MKAHQEGDDDHYDIVEAGATSQVRRRRRSGRKRKARESLQEPGQRLESHEKDAEQAEVPQRRSKRTNKGTRSGAKGVDDSLRK